MVLAGVIAAAAPSTYAYAGGGGKAKEAGGEAKGAGEAEVKPNDPTEVSMPPVIVPVTRDTKLVGYLYVGVILKAADEAQAKEIGKAMPLLQDATLRAMNRTPVPIDEAETAFTKALLLERLEATLLHVEGAPPVQSIKIQDVLSAPF